MERSLSYFVDYASLGTSSSNIVRNILHKIYYNGQTFSTAKARLYGFHPVEGHEARTGCAKGLVEEGFPIPTERQTTAWTSRPCTEEI